MATSTSNDKPTADQRVKHNIAPQTKPAATEKDNEPTGGTPGPSAEELAKREADRVEEERQRVEAETKASLKGTAVDGLNLPEKQGEVLWQTGYQVGVREAGEKDGEFNKRWQEAENTVVAAALQVMSGPGGIRPNGYQLVRDESVGLLRLNLVSADPDYPDPKRVGGVPNADGTY